MLATSVVPAALVVFAAIATIAAISRFLTPAIRADRFGSVDGLRGYLALFVYLHHSSVWYFFLQTGNWGVPPSNLYTHFGESSVELFFMVTGFLFFSKIIEGKIHDTDWLKIAISRILRLVPLYLLTMALLFCIVAVISSGIRIEPLAQLSKDVIRWLSFTILGAPDLNGVEHTQRIMAGVAWTMRYEWLFYFSLPMLALFMRSSVSLAQILTSIAGLFAILVFWRPQTMLLFCFVGGMAAAFCVKSRAIRSLASSQLVTWGILAILVALVSHFRTGYGYPQILLLTVVFIAIASGNSLFGILTSRISRSLGEITYSIYLLHGIMLYVFFHYVLGMQAAVLFSPAVYWTNIVLLTPVLLGCSALSFLYIEAPAIRWGRPLANWVRNRRRFFDGKL